jgi:hypothetical protein
MYEDTPLFYLYLTLITDSFEVMQGIQVIRKKEKVSLKKVKVLHQCKFKNIYKLIN